MYGDVIVRLLSPLLLWFVCLLSISTFREDVVAKVSANCVVCGRAVSVFDLWFHTISNGLLQNVAKLSKGAHPFPSLILPRVVGECACMCTHTHTHTHTPECYYTAVDYHSTFLPTIPA